MMPTYNYIMRVKRAGGFESFAKQHIGLLASVVAKCTGGALPEAVALFISTFIADPGDPGLRQRPSA